jgi:peptidoglycan LD-endopeptidase LytH
MAKEEYNLNIGKPLHPLMNFPDKILKINNISGKDLPKLSQFVAAGNWGMGGYLEKREDMYVAPHFQGLRNVHMGVDIWAPAGEPVFAPFPGIVLYTENRKRNGDYGGTVVIEHTDRKNNFFALYGHLAEKTLESIKPGQKVKPGDVIGWIGNEKENGFWPPHLHLQISNEDPGMADMPGVVLKEELEEAMRSYPDPRFLLGNIPDN